MADFDPDNIDDGDVFERNSDDEAKPVVTKRVLSTPTKKKKKQKSVR
jgi:hypothetical protein